IDPISLLFGKGMADDPIQLARGGEVVAKRFLNDDPGPAPLARFVQPRRLQVFQDRLELIGRSRKVEKAITARPAFLVDLIETFRQTFVTGSIFKFALMVKNRLRKSFPNFVPDVLPGKFAGRFLKLAPELVVGFLAARETDNGGGGRQLTIGGQIIECRDEFAVREIAGRAENHDRARLRHRARRKSFAQWI